MKTAAIYTRISRDPEGVRAGVERQEEDCRKAAEAAGYAISRVYCDNDTGASTLSRKRRPEYEAMLKAASMGEFSAVFAYSNSRLTRRPRELEDLLDLYDRHGVKIMTVVSGSDDLSTADGRMTARIKASVDAAEAERTGERLKRAFLQKAQNGAVNQGTRPFGWADDKITLHPVEAAMIREAAADMIDGSGLRSIVRRWNEAGVTTARGNEWDHRALRQLLKAPRLAGWRVHQGRIATDADGKPVRGVWEAVMDQDTFDRLQAVLTGRAGRGGRRGARRYLLSGVARCGTCGARMFGSSTPTGHAYTCRKDAGGAGAHTVSITGGPTDEVVSAVVQARLRGERLTATGDSEPRTTFEGAERLGMIPDLIAELMSEYNAGRLSGSVVFPQVAKLEAERADLAVERDRFISATAAPDARQADPDAFPDLDMDRQRAIIERLLEAVVIAPSRKGARWDADRITYVWRQS